MRRRTATGIRSWKKNYKKDFLEAREKSYQKWIWETSIWFEIGNFSFYLNKHFWGYDHCYDQENNSWHLVWLRKLPVNIFCVQTFNIRNDWILTLRQIKNCTCTASRSFQLKHFGDLNFFAFSNYNLDLCIAFVSSFLCTFDLEQQITFLRPKKWFGVT